MPQKPNSFVHTPHNTYPIKVWKWNIHEMTFICNETFCWEIFFYAVVWCSLFLYFVSAVCTQPPRLYASIPIIIIDFFFVHLRFFFEFSNGIFFYLNLRNLQYAFHHVDANKWEKPAQTKLLEIRKMKVEID